MDVLHRVSTFVLRGRLFKAPVENPLDILDVGTGTGIWAIEVGDEYPAAVVIGTDLSPIQPSWVPSNVHFEVDDCETEWTFSKKFDFVHLRNLAGSISDWPLLLHRSFMHLKPGGWVEITSLEAGPQSANGSLNAESATSVLWSSLRTASEMSGRPIDLVDLQLGQCMKDAGFQDVTDSSYEV